MCVFKFKTVKKVNYNAYIIDFYLLLGYIYNEERKKNYSENPSC